jgi:hypothetical protein
MANDFEASLERLLAANDVTDWQLLPRRGKHRSVVISHGGREWRFFYPNSPSDGRRGPLNFTSLVRRKLGLTAR